MGDEGGKPWKSGVGSGLPGSVKLGHSSQPSARPGSPSPSSLLSPYDVPSAFVGADEKAISKMDRLPAFMGLAF